MIPRVPVIRCLMWRDNALRFRSKTKVPKGETAVFALCRTIVWTWAMKVVEFVMLVKIVLRQSGLGAFKAGNPLEPVP